MNLLYKKKINKIDVKVRVKRKKGEKKENRITRRDHNSLLGRLKRQRKIKTEINE